jgi:DNA-binding NtrC family response regulator
MGKVKVLIVDDEMDFLEIMDAKITAWGYEVLKVSNGKQALEIIHNDKPDIAIIDYLMPEMDGVSLLKKIRQVDTKIPVIMFTAHPDVKVMKGTEGLNVRAFIPKLSTYSSALSNLQSAINMIERELRQEE